MSSDPFPERIDAVKLFARQGSISAAVPLARLQRFTDYLSGHTGQVAVNLQFGADEQGRRLLTGTLAAQVELACQRCLRDMDLELHCTLSILVFDTEDELQIGQCELPESQDAVTMPEEGLDVIALIEDELILSLPMVPMHADPACNQAFNALRQGMDPVEEARPNPFAALAALKAGDTKPEKDLRKGGRKDGRKDSNKAGNAGKIDKTDK